MGFLKQWGQSLIDVARGKKSLARHISNTSESILGKHNFLSNTLMSAHGDVSKTVNQIGGWDNVALIAGSILLGPYGGAAGSAIQGALGAAEGASILSGTASVVGAAAAGYMGQQEHEAIKAEQSAARAEAAATAEYNAKVAAEEEKARQARRAGLLATKKSLTKNITKGYQSGSGGTTSTDLNVGSIVLG